MWRPEAAAVRGKCMGLVVYVLAILVPLPVCNSFFAPSTPCSPALLHSTVFPSISQSPFVQGNFFQRKVARRGTLGLWRRAYVPVIFCSHKHQDSAEWLALPHVDRRRAIRTAAAAALSPKLILGADGRAAGAVQESVAVRSPQAIDSWGAIPVWPAWPTPSSPTGGRVRPIALPVREADPFLLLAHHRHSFSPGDPLRRPFREAGRALGLPYVGDEGFAMHPHRGLDIWTIVLEGSDGFRHCDSLGGECTYRGGAAQVMRAGRGVLHEEMWETRPDRPTRIELLQLWVNLPARLKMSPPAIRYLGADWGAPYPQHAYRDPVSGATTQVQVLSDALAGAREGEGGGLEERPRVGIRLARVPPGGGWVAAAAAGETALCYVLRGRLQAGGGEGAEVRAGRTCRFGGDGDAVAVRNGGKAAAEVLLLTGAPLGEEVALGGPVVMNSREELAAAYAQLRAGTFLDPRPR